MEARICTNPTCRTILPYYDCSLCGTRTELLPHVSLALIGVNGTAHLSHDPSAGYKITVKTLTSIQHLSIPMNTILHTTQPRLPNLDPASGLEIMDTLKSAARLIQTKNSGHWPGWILYLLEALQGHTDQVTFQGVLRELRHDLEQAIVEDDVPPEVRTWTGNLPRPSGGK